MHIARRWFIVQTLKVHWSKVYSANGLELASIRNQLKKEKNLLALLRTIKKAIGSKF